MMKKLLERNEFLIYLCQQIIKLLKDHLEAAKSLSAPHPVFISIDEVADKCLVRPRQVRRWMQHDKIVPQRWIGSSPYFSPDYIEDALRTGVLRSRKKRRGE